MSETLKTADIAQLVKETGPAPEQRLGAMSRGLIGSEILRIANEIRAIVAKGASVCDLTVGDFNPQHFPIPSVMSKALTAAIERGQTNYPPTSGLNELREAVQKWYSRELGLEYPLESILINSGSRPGIYGTFRTVCDTGDRVVYSIPSWNNNHYTHLVGGVGATIQTGAADRFLPSREAVRAALPGTRLLCLCTPLNPTGTMIAKDVLFGISEDIVRENESRERRGERPLYLLYDQVYWTLTFGDAKHYTPPGLVPEMARYTVFVDGISKAFAATGLRVGWAVGPVDVIAKMSSLLAHVGAWAPRPEQFATIALLGDPTAVREFQTGMKRGLQSRLDALRKGFAAMQAEGLPVDSSEPAGAIYLAAQIAPFGRRTPDGAVLATNDDVRRYVLTAAGMGVVPFQAFGSTEDDGWFRLSVGAVSLAEVEAMLPRLRTALLNLK